MWPSSQFLFHKTVHSNPCLQYRDKDIMWAMSKALQKFLKTTWIAAPLFGERTVHASNSSHSMILCPIFLPPETAEEFYSSLMACTKAMDWYFRISLSQAEATILSALKVLQLRDHTLINSTATSRAFVAENRTSRRGQVTHLEACRVLQDLFVHSREKVSHEKP